MEWWQAVSDSRAIGAVGPLSDLTHDSRQVKPGTGFIAVPGRQSDGHSFLENAAEAGAGALVVQADREATWSYLDGRVPIVVVPDSRAAMGPMAAAVHGMPSARLLTVGVTGTDGKTTSSHLIAHVLSACGLDCGYLTSAGFDAGDGFQLNESHMTTLEATSIQRELARALSNGRRSMVVEASSEGLAQQRLEGCQFDVGVFTNLTRDHLDFHGTMENYLAAKGILFEMLARPSDKAYPRAAVINVDDPASAYLKKVAGAPLLGYGESPGAGLRLSDITAAEGEMRFKLHYKDEDVAAMVPLSGRFNAFNAAAAAGVALSQGASLRDAVAALVSFPGVPGRLERIEAGQAFRVYVDIASTPAALENVLNALRPVTRGRLWAVFGAAGGRDPVRRSGMGEVAARLADRVVLTNEDPRHEDPEAIIDAIARSLAASGRKEDVDFWRRPDRREAIALAFEQAEAGDTVLLAGKATETSMVFSDRVEPWDERGVARQLLAGA